MANITRQQIDSINNRCSNDWELDVDYYLMHNDKTLIKRIYIDEEHYLKFCIRYNSNNQVILHISNNYHKKGEYFSTSHGMGKTKILEETQAPRKNINNLIDFTRKLTNTELLEINKNTKVSSGNGLFLPSEDF